MRKKTIKIEEIEERKESWYAIYLVLAIILTGLFSMLFLNVFFKMVGLATVVMATIVLIQIINKFQRRFDEEWQMMVKSS